MAKKREVDSRKVKIYIDKKRGEKYIVILAATSLLVSLFFFSFNITGNAIMSSDLRHDGSILGIIFFSIGVFGMFIHAKKSGLIKKIGAGLVGAAALASASCATIADPSYREFVERSVGKGMVKAMRALGVKRAEDMDLGMKNEFYANLAAARKLRTAAGIRDGTIEVTGETEKGGYELEGDFVQYSQQEAFDEVCEEADTDNNHYITDQEARKIVSYYDKSAIQKWINRKK